MRGKGSQVAPGLLVERVGLPSPTATEHLARLKAPLEELGLEPDVLQGGVGKKARRLITDRLAAARSGEGVVLLATGSFLGECSGRPAGDSRARAAVVVDDLPWSLRRRRPIHRRPPH